MIEFIQKQIEASERLFNVMKTDHNQRMAEMEHWARTTQSLIEKLHERDMTINMLRNGKNVPDMGTNVPNNVTTEDVSFENPERRMKILEKQIEALVDQVSRLKDENEALRLDLGLKGRGL